MAEGFEFYHVPQQSRREKLRVVTHNHLSGLVPLYDPSPLICPDSADTDRTVKEESMKLMFYTGGAINNCSSSSSSSSSLMDPQSNLQMNPPPSIPENPVLYNPSGMRVFDRHPFNGEFMVYKPEQLALSLSSHNTHQRNLPLELNLQRLDSSVYGSNGGDTSRNAVPLGPFTGYASILKGSRFLKPAQELLEEICDVGCGFYVGKFGGDDESGAMDDSLEGLSRSGVGGDDPNAGGEWRRKTKLISMLDEVSKRYKQYYQQLQAVVASFENVSGLSNAAPFANLALKAMSKHFRSLKNAIADQLQFVVKAHNHSGRNESAQRPGSSDGGLYGQRPTGLVDHQPIWRPQRGLPKRAVTVLRAWLFEHFLHPYPTDTDKLMLAKQTGLSRNQVSNWFINARVRLWKPMVEEIHSLETRQGQKSSQREEAINNLPTTANPLVSENHPSPPAPVSRSQSSQRSRNDFSTPSGSGAPVNTTLYDNFSRQRGQLCIEGANTSGSGNAYLSLGLHQNSRFAPAQPFHTNAARRFGLDPGCEGFLMGGFEG